MLSTKSVVAAPSIVTTSGRQLILQKRKPDGGLQPAAPYIVRGINWSAASRNTDTTKEDPQNANVRRPEFAVWARIDLPLIKRMNANTVRVPIDFGLDANGLNVLDQIYQNGLMAIVTVDDAVNNITRAQQVVNLYKDHPAVLMWNIGNEWNINLYYGKPSCNTPALAAQCTENAAVAVKALDPNHPVATSYGEIDINSTGLRLADTFNYVNNIASHVDVWGL